MRSPLTAFVVASVLFACKALAVGGGPSELSGAALAATETTKEKRGAARRDPPRTDPAARPRTEASHPAPADRSARGADVVEPPAQPAQDSGPTCCCRYFSQGWQHGWRTQGSCESHGGACVAPDRCQS